MAGSLPSIGVDVPTLVLRGPAGRSPEGSARERLATVAATATLLLFSYLFRLPPLLNARATNSDAAVVGLQAMHLLRGELSPFLWGSGYQTSADAFVAAGFFAIAGPTPLSLMLSALTLHVAATWLVFATIRRRFDPWTSLVLVLPLVFAPSSIHSYALYPPRQLAITLATAALWALDGAEATRARAETTGAHAETTGARAETTGARVWLGVGGALYGLAISADPYPIVLAPIVLGFGLVVAGGDAGRRAALLGAFLGGVAPFVLLHASADAKSGVFGLSTAVVGHNWDLLVRECLPWALSYKVYSAREVMDYRPWDAPVLVQAVQIAGAVVVAGLVGVGLGAGFIERLPRPVRRLGFASAASWPVTLVAFLGSVMVMDHFSMRYLAALTLMLPFAVMPAAWLLGTRRFAVAMTPHLVASALCGWVGYGPLVRGPLPVLETPELRDDDALLDVLRARGIRYAQADYWASYRLTFLFGERVVVVPTNAAEDRYAPYRRAFDDAPVFAYVFDRRRSREDVTAKAAELSRTNASVIETQVGGHTVFVVTRTKPGAVEPWPP
ncbi:MAG: hypothetical protein KF764_21970 [Labilithrix sp.]|nr:hypothetical protein [Labilithrix sp.]